MINFDDLFLFASIIISHDFIGPNGAHKRLTALLYGLHGATAAITK